MIARLWWKESRRVWPIWALLAGFGLPWVAATWLSGNSAGQVLALGLGGPVLAITCVYMFLVGATAFAGEREDRTLGLLDALPVERWRLWFAKATFAAATTAALGGLLLLAAWALEGLPPADNLATVGFLLACGFGWSLLWSAVSANSLLAAALGMGSLALTFIQMNWDDPLAFAAARTAAPSAWHWWFAAALLFASALILQLGGPPRRPWFASQGRSRPAPVERGEAFVRSYADMGRGSGLTSRLVWQAWRETWPIWWPLALLGVGSPLVAAWSGPSTNPWPWTLGAWFVGLVLGANVFNAENRGRTQPFLAHHGARPGVIWLVKLAVGLAAVASIWIVMHFLASVPWWTGIAISTPRYGASFSLSALASQFILLFGGAFAAGAWCGMVFRRGITAALVSAAFWVVVCGPPLWLSVERYGWLARHVRLEHLFWVPVAVLVVTWAWSGDWLLDRRGNGRWARLGLYSAAAIVALSSAHAANRAWSVPTIPPAEFARILQFDRIAAPIPPEENAADLYRRILADALIHARVKGLETNWREIHETDWDMNDPEILDWLRANESNLQLLRKAAAMPDCRFEDIGTMFEASLFSDTSRRYLLERALAASSRARFAQGDLKGSWEDLEALLRMGRHFRGLNPEPARTAGAHAERVGLMLALRWANDPRQTAEALKAARDSHRAIPPLPSLADQIRAGALVIRNTTTAFSVTPPWEVARFRRAHDLLAAARVQAAERWSPRPELSAKLELNLPLGPLTFGEGPRATTISPDELLEVIWTTPLTTERTHGIRWYGSPEADMNLFYRRVLDAILSLRLWQAQHGGLLPGALDELVKADPDVAGSLIDPYTKASDRFEYARSQGEPLVTLEPLRSNSLTVRTAPTPTDGYMILRGVGHEILQGEEWTARDVWGYDDNIFPIKDNVPPPPTPIALMSRSFRSTAEGK